MMESFIFLLADYQLAVCCSHHGNIIQEKEAKENGT